MRRFARPVVVFSRCLGFAACRYDGEIVVESAVEALKLDVEARPYCPELEVSLGAPRDPIRLVSSRGELRLVQPTTGLDLTESMRKAAASFLEPLGDVDGFVLKASSPSCGLRDAKVYAEPGSAEPLYRTRGIFAAAVLGRFRDLPIVSEKTLRRPAARHHAFTRLFAAADFRAVRASGRRQGLVRFHSENKLLLFAHSEANERAMGRLVANLKGRPLEEILADYERLLRDALLRPARRGGHANALMHALGHFSRVLSRDEKAAFLARLDAYREGRGGLGPILVAMRDWIARFEEPYLATQTYFEPFPGGLMENVARVPDASGRTRRSSSP